MVKQTQTALSDAAEWLGDWHPLAEQLGSADGLLALSSICAVLRLRPVQNLSSLRRFLLDYQEHILFPLELPAIETAFSHASRNETRELVALDRGLAADALLQPFSDVSKRVGQYQLQKLRPLRDQRLLQRYLCAVETGEAYGWHTLVYGVTLAIYSLPLRQGLLGYAHQTTRGFIYGAARSLRLSEHQCRRLFDTVSASFPEAVEALLTDKGDLKEA